MADIVRELWLVSLPVRNLRYRTELFSIQRFARANCKWFASKDAQVSVKSQAVQWKSVVSQIQGSFIGGKCTGYDGKWMFYVLKLEKEKIRGTICFWHRERN